MTSGAPRGREGEHSPVARLDDSLRPEEAHWYGAALQALRREGIPFMLAGAFGLYQYTGFWRGTKDLDILILPEHREACIEAMQALGMPDMYPEEPYDRGWIYRSSRDGVIVDLIWMLANHEDEIDRGWFERSTPAALLGIPVRCVGASDLCWMKLFVFQLQRCDWPDILNVIRGTCGELDWDNLLEQVGPHWRLVSALVEIYDWLCPAERCFIPDTLRRELEQRRRVDPFPGDACRSALFDSRPWLTEPGVGRHPG